MFRSNSTHEEKSSIQESISVIYIGGRLWMYIHFTTALRGGETKRRWTLNYDGLYNIQVRPMFKLAAFRTALPCFHEKTHWSLKKTDSANSIRFKFDNLFFYSVFIVYQFFSVNRPTVLNFSEFELGPIWEEVVTSFSVDESQRFNARSVCTNWTLSKHLLWK